MANQNFAKTVGFHSVGHIYAQRTHYPGLTITALSLYDKMTSNEQ